MRPLSGTRVAIVGVAAALLVALGSFFLGVAQSQTTPTASIWGNGWMRAALGCWAVAVVVAALGLLVRRTDEIVAVAQGPTIEEETADLARELLSFYEPWATGLPPLEHLQVGKAPPGAMKQWEEQRDAAVLAEYRRVFADRVTRVYETLRDKRGYAHPQMEGRYDNVQLAGEVFTIARALGQMVGVEITMSKD